VNTTGQTSPTGPADFTRKDPRWHIRVRGLTKRFGEQEVLRGVDLDIERGKINIIVGGSGQGKSVFMKHLMGLLHPDDGAIYVDGQDIVGLGEKDLGVLRRKFGMVFQYAALFDSMTIMENIAFPLLERYKLPLDEVKERVRELLVKLDLVQTGGAASGNGAAGGGSAGGGPAGGGPAGGGIEDKFPPQLSGGMRKRVGLARALIDRPQILLYDEPTTGLDPIATKNVDDMIRRTADEFGVTSVVISHDMASTFRIADRVSMLMGGQIIQTGTPAELMANPHPELREFLETSGTLPPPGAAA
jgi:phospholipid/cholesterol/gamma-HCH transport system ATP-binding protein